MGIFGEDISLGLFSMDLSGFYADSFYGHAFFIVCCWFSVFSSLFAFNEIFRLLCLGDANVHNLYFSFFYFFNFANHFKCLSEE